MAGVFAECQIVLDLTTSVPFKKKLEIKKKIIEHGGIVSFIVTKKSTHVVGNDPEKYDVSYKCQMAAKYGIPVVFPEFIWTSIKMGKLPNSDDYIIGGRSKKSDFKSGKITAGHPKVNEKKKAKSLFSIKGTRAWKFGDKDAPFFDEMAFEIAKYAAFQGYDKKTESQLFYVLELQVADPASKNAKHKEFKYRIFTHYGSVQEVQEGNMGTQECRYTQTVDIALGIYSHLYKQQTMPSRHMVAVHGGLPRGIGSPKLQKMLSEMMTHDESLAPPVVDLIEHIWREAAGEVEEMINTPVSQIKVEQIEKAEAILLQIREAFYKSTDMQQLLTDFYSILQHSNEGPQSITISKAWLAKKQDLCQLIKDMVSVNEATNWSTRSSVEAKYRALRCKVGHLEISDSQYKLVKDLVESSIIGDLKVQVKSIYEVQRPIEDCNFVEKISNKQLLFHSSKAENFVGILSRGLLLPKIVVDDFGGTRTDAGMLGSGLYFASAASTSAKYSQPSKTKGTRLMLVNEIALGQCLDVFKHDTELKGPPEGYHSVHGVRKSDGVESEFVDDEYVIYSLNQQRIRYLVEFALDGDTLTQITMSEVETDMEDVSSGICDIDLDDVQGIEDPLSKVKSGLICDQAENAVQLKGVHIRARLVDLAAEVIVMQEYHNNMDVSIEAKFIFPLDDMAAVCGFEAFINGKHIIGEVKEKETAHKEYKQAISEGHGAYLMDQDEETPDVFTVSVGNLPPGACVLIKITYVAELQVEGEVISFRLPGSVAPWKEDSATKETTQTQLDTHKVQIGKTSVQVSVDMPFDIHSIECPTHKLRIKKTATKAVIEIKEGQSFKDGFQLLIGLAEIHVPRMWVENHLKKSDHQACMLTFYPEFEAGEQDDLEIVFLLDLSNSMKGDALEDSKKILLLTLSQLPPHALFNIVVFGTAYKELFPISEANTPVNTAKAHQFVKESTATMGNTEIFRPLHSNHLLSSESSTTNIFLISDGHINNEDIVLNSVLTNSAQTRLFTFGVSSTSNMHLLRSLARVGGGAFEFFDRKVKSKWENKVKKQITKAAQPGLSSVSVEWQQFDEDPASLPQAPRQITALFSGSRQVIYGFVPNCTMATLKAVVGGQEVCTVVSTSDLSITQGMTVHRLTARAMIRDWEDGMLSSDRTRHEILKMNLKPYIIDLSTEYSIVTQFTSFVAVEKRDEDEKAGKWKGTGPSIAELIEQEVVDMLSYIPMELETKATKEELHEEEIKRLGLPKYFAEVESVYDWGQDDESEYDDDSDELEYDEGQDDDEMCDDGWLAAYDMLKSKRAVVEKKMEEGNVEEEKDSNGLIGMEDRCQMDPNIPVDDGDEYCDTCAVYEDFESEEFEDDDECEKSAARNLLKTENVTIAKSDEVNQDKPIQERLMVLGSTKESDSVQSNVEKTRAVRRSPIALSSVNRVTPQPPPVLPPPVPPPRARGTSARCSEDEEVCLSVPYSRISSNNYGGLAYMSLAPVLPPRRTSARPLPVSPAPELPPRRTSARSLPVSPAPELPSPVLPPRGRGTSARPLPVPPAKVLPPPHALVLLQTEIQARQATASVPEQLGAPATALLGAPATALQSQVKQQAGMQAKPLQPQELPSEGRPRSVKLGQSAVSPSAEQQSAPAQFGEMPFQPLPYRGRMFSPPLPPPVPPAEEEEFTQPPPHMGRMLPPPTPVPPAEQMFTPPPPKQKRSGKIHGATTFYDTAPDTESMSMFKSATFFGPQQTEPMPMFGSPAACVPQQSAPHLNIGIQSEPMPKFGAAGSGSVAPISTVRSPRFLSSRLKTKSDSLYGICQQAAQSEQAVGFKSKLKKNVAILDGMDFQECLRPAASSVSVSADEPQKPIQSQEHELEPMNQSILCEEDEEVCLSVPYSRISSNNYGGIGYAAKIRRSEEDIIQREIHTEKAGVKTSDELSDDKYYGIGVSVSRVRSVAGTSLSFSDLGTLINLQDTKGFWELNDELEKVLGINVKSCKNILFSAGLMSLGPHVTKETIYLLATALALLSICELLCPEFAFNLSLAQLKWSFVKEVQKEVKKQQGDIKKKMTDSQVTRAIQALSKGLLYCEDFDNRHPLTYSTLELGPSWVSVSAKLLGICA